jgi:uncharacterized protein YtpQ (UPF0354 family)
VSTDEWRTQLQARLEQAGIDVTTESADTWHVSRGGDPFEATGSIDPDHLVAQIEAADRPDRSTFTSAIVRGILEALFEPDASDADAWDFEKAAGSILPTIEGPGFALGASSLADGDIWAEPFEANLSLTYRLLLDNGKRVLTEQQLDGWQATRDRVSSAARSLLFHHTRDASASPVDGYDGLESLAVEDGHDAARLIVLEDVMFGEFDDSSRIAIPTPDTLLFVRRGDEATTRALREAAQARFEASSQPLTTTLFQFRRSKPKPVQ